MKVRELFHFLDGFAFTNDDVVKMAKITLLESMKQKPTIIGAMVTLHSIGLPYMKDGSATNANAVGSLKVVQLATPHTVNTAGTPSRKQKLKYLSRLEFSF